MQRFRQIYIEITNVCNLHCAFCPGSKRPAEFMTTDQFAALLPQVKPLTEQIYLHVLGEPLLHPDFHRLIELAGQFGVPVAITTNGSRMATPQAEALLLPGVRQVNISLHSLYEEKISEPHAARLTEIIDFTRRAFQQRPDLYINYRLWNFDASRISPENELNEWLCREVAAAFNIPIPTVNFSSGRKNRRLLNRLYLDLDTRFEWPEIVPGNPVRLRGFCHGMSGQIGILVDGTVVPCCLDRDGIIALGNTWREPLGEIIDSPRARAMREGFVNGNLVEPLCRHCTFRTRFPIRRVM